MNKEEFKKHCELQALWWIASATTGACKNRQMYHGTTYDKPYTDDEKVQEALDTAQYHIHLYREECEKGGIK